MEETAQVGQDVEGVGMLLADNDTTMDVGVARDIFRMTQDELQ